MSCGNRHNTSVHGYLAYCHDTHPFVQSWYFAWPNPGIVTVWRQSAHHKERRIAARLCIPTSLYAHLRHRLGFVTARASIKLFQRQVVDNVTLALQTITGGTHPTSPRPDPYSIADWRENSARPPLPDTLKRDKLCCFRSVACVPCPLALQSIEQCRGEIETGDGEMLTKPAKPSKAPLEGKTKRTPHIVHPSARLMAQRQILVQTSTLVPLRPCPGVCVVPHRPCHLRAVRPPSLSRIYPRPPPCRLPTFTTRHLTRYLRPQPAKRIP